jgi:hypothetical protein
MNIKEILAISGKPGLYKLLSQGKNSIIVESLMDSKRFPVYEAHQISALEEISIYTETDDVPIKDVFQKMFDKLEGKEAMSHKSSAKELIAFFAEILPDFDRDRVYNSDIKKVFQWYNALCNSGYLEMEDESEGETEPSSDETVSENTEE